MATAVFVVHLDRGYDGDEFLGVNSTMELARARAQAHADEQTQLRRRHTPDTPDHPLDWVPPRDPGSVTGWVGWSAVGPGTIDPSYYEILEEQVDD